LSVKLMLTEPPVEVCTVLKIKNPLVAYDATIIGIIAAAQPENVKEISVKRISCFILLNVMMFSYNFQYYFIMIHLNERTKISTSHDERLKFNKKK